MACAASKALRWLALLLGLLGSLGAAAHPVPESQVWIDTRPEGLQLTLRLPLNRLEFAFGQPLSDAPQQALQQHREALSRYLLAHLGLRSGAAGWTLLRPALAIVGEGSTAELEAVLPARAPAGADARRFELLYDVITHEVRTHRAMVFLRTDWEAGQVAQPPRPLGELTPQLTTLAVALDDPQAGSGWPALLKLGAAHIAQGTDHLLFLLTLLLVAPLLPRAGRWAGAQPVRTALRRIALVVTAFTAGHSITLVLGSLGLVSLPVRWVETAVALSIVVAALNAWRPLRERGEPLMAAGFGLLHGLAFSASLDGAGLTAGQHAQALLAFNLGIEAMQLAIVAAVMPPLLVLAARAPVLYAAGRQVGALLAMAAASLWALERALPELTRWLADAPAVDARLAQGLCAGLWVVAVLVLLGRRSAAR